MLDRLKKSLVESYVGAIGLGWLFAQGILHFAYVFSAPVTTWIMRDEYRRFGDHAATSGSLLIEYAGAELARSFFLLVLWYILMRWLYFKPLADRPPDLTPNPEQPVPTPPAN